MNCPLRVSAIVSRKDIVNSLSAHHLARSNREVDRSNNIDAIALAKTIKIMEAVGMEKITDRQQHLTALMLEDLSAIPE